jgi:membrane associated rhomboid family serine protease
MIPLRDVIPSRTRPIATLVLVTLNLVVVLAQVWSSSGSGARASVPNALLLGFGHANGLLFAANMVCLWLFGSTVEDRTGHVRFVVLYVLGGLVAATLAAVLAPHASLGGCVPSGAVAGVASAYLWLFPRSRVLVLIPAWIGVELADLPAWLFAAIWTLLYVLSALADSSWTQLVCAAAGAFTGLGACLWLRRPERLRVDWWG